MTTKAQAPSPLRGEIGLESVMRGGEARGEARRRAPCPRIAMVNTPWIELRNSSPASRLRNITGPMYEGDHLEAMAELDSTATTGFG